MVFFCGIACAILLALVSHFFSFHAENVWKTKFKRKAFSAIPDDEQIRVSEDIHLEVALRARSDINVADVTRNSGNDDSYFEMWYIFSSMLLFLVLSRSCVYNQSCIQLPAAEAEAEGSLFAALEMKRQGKTDKALKLFEHAYILAPLHPDVLNHYGEFLEDTKKDIIMADQLYFQVPK